MIFSIDIIKDLSEKSNLRLERVKDLELLAGDMFEVTGRNIGITTLKRLLGIIKDDRRTNAFTLNTIALYLGYESWEEYTGTKNLDSIWDFEDDAVYIHNLPEGTSVTIRYLDRIVEFEVRLDEELNRKVLAVVSAENSSLRPGDILYVYSIEKGRILQAENLTRGTYTGTFRTTGEIASIDLA